MTITKFKEKYPQYSHLEGDVLWNTMEDVLLQSDDVLHADPNQVKVFHKPIETEFGKVFLEDSSTTRWLNNKGELVRVGEPNYPEVDTPTESYRMVIMDFKD